MDLWFFPEFDSCLGCIHAEKRCEICINFFHGTLILDKYFDLKLMINVVELIRRILWSVDREVIPMI